MPKRKRSHRIEGESRRAFESALDERFLFRDDVPDYGIDGSVEEFGSDDHATGLRYFVQLKATDGKDPRSALRRSIPLEHASFYSALSLPLLMVRYVAPTQTLYARWWHAGPARRAAAKPGAASFTFYWDESDKASPGESERWAEEARSFLELRSAAPPLPFHFEISIDDPPFGLTAIEIELAIKAEAKRRPDVVKIVPAKGNGRLTVRGPYLAVDMPGMTAASFDIDGDYTPGRHGEQIAIDLMTLVAVSFTRWGQAELAARMASRFLARSSLVSQPAAVMPLANAMTSARRVSEALALAEEIDTLGLPPEGNLSVLFTLIPRQHAASLDDLEVKEFRGALQRRISRREEAGEKINASRELLTLGNHYRSRADPTQAITHYERAAELDPEYLNRAHYWFELAGVMFGAGQYTESATAYEKAINLGTDEMAPLLRADALMFSGRYEAARKAFERELDDTQSLGRVAEYQLKLRFLEFLVETQETRNQERDPKGASDIVDSAIEDGNRMDAETALLSSGQALVFDSLCGAAWWNLGIAFESMKRFDMVAPMFLHAALCSPGDDKAWALALLHFWKLDQVGLLPMILVTGERFTDGKVLPTINHVMSLNLSKDERARFLKHFSEMADEFSDPRPDGLELRFVGPGQPVQSMAIPGADTRAIDQG
jgi:tetratricopeptide (TPR) repeat protein